MNLLYALLQGKNFYTMNILYHLFHYIDYLYIVPKGTNYYILNILYYLFHYMDYLYIVLRGMSYMNPCALMSVM